MGTYFNSAGFSSCEIGGFFASALLHDLRVNNFTFTNFPEVCVSWDDKYFYITLKVHVVSSSTFSLGCEAVKSEVKRFQKKDVSAQVVDVIQKHATELEGAVKIT